MKIKMEVFVIICLMIFFRCENPSSSKNDETSTINFCVKDTNNIEISNKDFSITFDNVLDKSKIWKKYIELDTTIYSTKLGGGGIIYIGNNDQIGTILLMTSDFDNSGAAAVLPKTNEKSNSLVVNSNIVKVATMYVFFIGEGIIEQKVAESIVLNKKNGESERINIEIDEPNQYLISKSEASFMLDKENIFDSQTDDEKIRFIRCRSEISPAYSQDNYFVVHVNNLIMDNPNEPGINIRNYATVFTPEIKNESGFAFSSNDFDFKHYTFIFKK